jgi:hypothetical protein
MGNIRSGGASTNGFGIYLSGTEKVRIGTDGRISNYAWTTTGRNLSNEWIEFPNASGLYSQINGAHFFPNTGSSYGVWAIQGTRNAYSGISFNGLTNGSVILMVYETSVETGFYNQANGWQFRWTSGTLYVGKGTYGGGTNAVVLDEVNYTSYAPSLTGSGASGTWGISITGNAATATNISNTGTVTLATATEANSIYITQPSYGADQPVKLLNFAWYSDVWQMGNIRSSYSASNGFGIYLSGAEKIRITTSGNFLINTIIDAGYKLDVNGTIRAQDNIIVDAGNNKGFTLNAGLAIYRVDGNHLGLFSASIERVRIASNGYVGINTNDPLARLDIASAYNSSNKLLYEYEIERIKKDYELFY